MQDNPYVAQSEQKNTDEQRINNGQFVPYDVYLGPFDQNNTDEQRINNDQFVPCRICEAVFGRITLTRRYCAECHKGFCEGQHGTFVRHRGICILDGPGP
jgi:hypothetical protein